MRPAHKVLFALVCERRVVASTKLPFKFLLSDAAFQEFNRQDVFATVDDFVEAMPSAIRSVHAVEITDALIEQMKADAAAEAAVSKKLANSPEAGYFGTQTHVRETDPNRYTPKDESIYKVDSPYNLPKEQTTPDSKDWSKFKPTFNEGKPSKDDPSKTKWPHRMRTKPRVK